MSDMSESKDEPTEADMRMAQDLLFFAYRDFTNAADVALTELGITVSDLLGILRITKQSLARVLSVLLDQGYVTQTPGRSDRRQRLLALTPSGAALERKLFERQRARLAPAWHDVGPDAVAGFQRVMRAIMDDAARAYIDGRQGKQH
jgi:DNA-binding MarR family transcriptional regulator